MKLEPLLSAGLSRYHDIVELAAYRAIIWWWQKGCPELPYTQEIWRRPVRLRTGLWQRHGSDILIVLREICPNIQYEWAKYQNKKVKLEVVAKKGRDVIKEKMRLKKRLFKLTDPLEDTRLRHSPQKYSPEQSKKSNPEYKQMRPSSGKMLTEHVELPDFLNINDQPDS